MPTPGSSPTPITGRGAWALLAALLAAGCATPPSPPLSAPLSAPPEWPDEAFITQRAVLTLRGRQFAMNGYLARSASRGMRLVVTGNLGDRMADLLVTPDGRVVVIRSSRLFPPDWIRRHMAADLQCLFGPMPEAGAPLDHPEPNLYRLTRPRYELEVRIVETRPGPQPPGLFEAPAAPSP